jgi:hypothetical protein
LSVLVKCVDRARVPFPHIPDAVGCRCGVEAALLVSVSAPVLRYLIVKLRAVAVFACLRLPSL